MLYAHVVCIPALLSACGVFACTLVRGVLVGVITLVKRVRVYHAISDYTSPAQIKLADKQAAVEKLQWEAMTSNQSVEKVQKDLEIVQEEISSFMLFFEGLARNTSIVSTADYDTVSCASDPSSDLVSQWPRSGALFSSLFLLQVLFFCAKLLQVLLNTGFCTCPCD